MFPAEFETRVGHFRDMSAELDGLNGTDALLVDLDLEDQNEMDAFSRFMGAHATSVPIVASSTNATVDDIRRRLGRLKSGVRNPL